jgi:ubiquinone/menaquinone biosynthesis C-methylase UbiE
MFKKYLGRLKQKSFAKQLRQPHGAAGIKVGIIMNNGNEVLYDFTLSSMQIEENESILEIGFGNGKFFNKLFSKAGNLTIAGIDYSETMLKEACEKNQASIASGKLALQQANSDRLPFADNSFDKVFCINVVYFWNDPQKHLEEINRVLKPGGKFFATIRSKSSMELMPFTKYGFTKYTEEEWKEVVKKTPLNFLKTERVDEPPLNFENAPLNIYSLCLVAQKNK